MSAHPGVPTALSIAGSDPSGGAGIQADLKTFAARGVYGMAVVTALTAQNTRTVAGVHGVPPDFVKLQLQTVLDDIVPGAVKVGMVGSAMVAEAILAGLAQYRGPLVVDPVMVATSGASLLPAEAEAALIQRLVPRATLVTPNLPEAARLLGETSPTEWTAQTGVALLLKDGHGSQDTVMDRLFLPSGASHTFRHARISSSNTHGTGCTLSSAIAAELALGQSLVDAVETAIAWLSEVIVQSSDHTLGGGSGPLLHGAAVRARLDRPSG